MTDLNIALILRLVDRATGPARAALRAVESVSDRMGQRGLASLDLADRMDAASQARRASLLGEAAGIAGVGYSLYRFMRPAVQFEQAMAQVGAVSRASDEDLARLTATARELGRDTSLSAHAAAEGMQFLAMAGFEVNEVIAAMPGVLGLATASGENLGTTADIVSNVLSGFKLEADEMGRAGDVLVNAFTSGNTNLSMLGATMEAAAPTAADLGISLEQVAGMAARLGDAGIQGEKAGTALRAIMARLAAPTGEAARALADLNIAVADADGNLRSMPDILSDMQLAMEGMGSAERANIRSLVFGLEAMGAASVLMDQAGSGALQNYIETLSEAGSAARVAAEMNDTLEGALKRIQSAITDVQIQIGNVFIPAMRDLVETVTPYINMLSEWAAAHPVLVEQLGMIGAGLFALKAATFAARFALEPFFALATVGVRAFGWLNVATGLTLRMFSSVARGMMALSRLRPVALSRLVQPLVWSARLIPAISWAALAGALNWRMLIRPLAWAARTGVRFIPVIGWALLAGELLWSLLIKPLGWDRFIPDIDWGYWLSFEWTNVLPAWDWSEVIPDLWTYLNRDAAPGENRGRGSGPTHWTKGRALGGGVRAGHVYEINEAGQEFFAPGISGRMIPAGAVAATRPQPSVTIGDIHVHAAPGMDEAALAREVRRVLRAERDQHVALHDGGLHD